LDLQKFCSKEIAKDALRKPFTQDGITWATNAWVAVGVPALADVPENDGAPNMGKLGKGLEPGEWFEIPAVDVHSCTNCEGEITDIECHECKGHGHVTLTNDYGRGKMIYEGIDCGSCDGEGRIEICPYCSGTGVDCEDGLLTIGPAQFKQNALWLIDGLPGIQISPTGPTTLAFLRFDGGGVGFLMPGKDNRGK
jgi:hypothetical protein